MLSIARGCWRVKGEFHRRGWQRRASRRDAEKGRGRKTGTDEWARKVPRTRGATEKGHGCQGRATLVRAGNSREGTTDYADCTEEDEIHARPRWVKKGRKGRTHTETPRRRARHEIHERRGLTQRHKGTKRRGNHGIYEWHERDDLSRRRRERREGNHEIHERHEKGRTHTETQRHGENSAAGKAERGEGGRAVISEQLAVSGERGIGERRARQSSVTSDQ